MRIDLALLNKIKDDPVQLDKYVMLFNGVEDSLADIRDIVTTFFEDYATDVDYDDVALQEYEKADEAACIRLENFEKSVKEG